MRASSLGACLIATACLIGCPGGAARPAAVPPPAPVTAARMTATAIDFEDDTIEGDLVKPDGDYVATRHKPKAPAILTAQNAIRAEHCAAPLVWSPELELRAMARARAVRDRGCDATITAPQPGENLTLAAAGTLTPLAAVAPWAREEERVDFPTPRLDPRTQRFTQLVWKDSLAVGCAPISCGDRDGWVCLYDPPGNVEADVELNVAPRGCR
jgi:pathogenesis-related protein 1